MNTNIQSVVITLFMTHQDPAAIVGTDLAVHEMPVPRDAGATPRAGREGLAGARRAMGGVRPAAGTGVHELRDLEHGPASDPEGGEGHAQGGLDLRAPPRLGRRADVVIIISPYSKA